MVADRLKDLGRKAVKAVDDLADRAVEGVEKIHKDIQGRGGYVQAGRGALTSIGNSTRDAYRSIEDAFFTEGSFDSEKAKRLLADNAEAARTYGAKAARVLADLASDGFIEIKESANDRFRRLVPTENERETTYAGIGSAYSGVLFRQHYEGCLTFHSSADQKIPRGLKLKGEMLEDIKASASGDANELSEYYRAALADANSDRSVTLRKFEATLRYLVNPA